MPFDMSAAKTIVDVISDFMRHILEWLGILNAK